MPVMGSTSLSETSETKVHVAKSEPVPADPKVALQPSDVGKLIPFKVVVEVV